MERLTFNDYFMTMALLIARRSSDNSTKHGAVLVDKNNKVLGIGFNGTPRGCKEHLIPQTRPDKYSFYIHAETNCIANSNNNNLYGSKLYVTGPCCCKCLGMLIQYGIKEIIYGPIVSLSPDSPHNKEEENNFKNIMLDGQDIILKKWNPDNLNLIKKNLESILDTLEENYEITDVPF